MADQAKPTALRDVVLSADSLREKRKELDTLRRPDLREWAQNEEFYRGNQWVYWNRQADRLETLGVDEGDRPRHKVRLTVNQITPGVQQLVAQKTKTRPVIHAVPNTGSDTDTRAAQVAEAIYEDLWRKLGLRTKLQSALVHAELSQGYWLIEYDEHAGDAIRYFVNPQTGGPIQDGRLEELFKEELAAQGVDPARFEQSLNQGEITVTVLSGKQVWLDPIATNFEDAEYAICRIPMSVDDIKARYGVDVAPDTSTDLEEPALMYTRGKAQQPKNARNVYHGYFKPTAALPKGRYICWIEGPNQILDQGDWNMPTNDLPLVKFPGIERPGHILDEARVTHVRPLQKELNNLVSRVAMHANLTLKPQMMAPVNSLRQRLTDEPGAIFEYAPIQGLAPEWRPMPALPGYVFEYAQEVQARIDRMFNLMPSERSQLPPRTDSGELLDLMQEAVADQISPEIARIEQALALAGHLMIALAQRYYISERTAKIIGPGGSTKVLKFKNADIMGGFSFHAEAGSGLPRTRAGQTKTILELVQAGAITMQQALPYLPIAGLKAVQAKIQTSEEAAQRAIDKLIAGDPINPVAMQQALEHVHQGLPNPYTGEMFETPDEAMQFIQGEALQPPTYIDLDATLDVLGTHMNSAEFEAYPVDVQARFQQYFTNVRSVMIQVRTALSGDPVKTTLSLRGTVGPTVAANILQQKGVQSATPQTMAEPPLDTQVYDSIDMPNQSEAGNDHMTDLEKGLLMEQSQQEHMLKTAKMGADAALAQKRLAQSDFRPKQAKRPMDGG